MFRLPSYQQLFEEQDAINNLPLDGSYLVVGPPGTGKTVLAIYRAAMFRKDGRRSFFIAHNRPLRLYLDQAMQTVRVHESAETFHRWFYHWYKKNFGREPPSLQRFVYDWTAIYHNIGSKSDLDRYEHLVIDEGQDLPREFFPVAQLIADDMTVFADENQRITETNSTLQDIRTYMGPHQLHRLTVNYRNTRPIARFAARFYAGLESGVPDLPERDGPVPQVVLTPDLQTQADFLVRYERNHADRDIGVFLPSADQLFDIHRKLTGRTRNVVQVYVWGRKIYQTLDFRHRGIRLATYQSAKGLEFDTVFLPALEKRSVDSRSEIERMQFYVLASRAREELFLMSSGNELPPLLQGIPADLYELRHAR